MTHLVIVFDGESDSPAVREELWQAFSFFLLFKYWGKEGVIKIHKAGLEFTFPYMYLQQYVSVFAYPCVLAFLNYQSY